MSEYVRPKHCDTNAEAIDLARDISIGSEISAVCDDPRKARFCINMNYSDFNKERARFKAAGNVNKKSAEGEIRTHETLADHQLSRRTNHSRLAPYR
jgi:hypothetical protein